MKPLTKEYIMSKGFMESSQFKHTPSSEFSSYLLGLVDVIYHIKWIDWDDRWDIGIEYTDCDYLENQIFGFGVLRYESDLDSFLNIISYKDRYDDYINPSNGQNIKQNK